MEHNDILLETLLEIPTGFKVGNRHFTLYHPTLGKVLYQQMFVEKLDIDSEKLKENPFRAFLSVAKEHKEECCWIIAINTCKTKEDVFSDALMSRVRFLNKELSLEDTASMLITLHLYDRTDELMSEFKIDKEQARLRRAMKAKDTKNTFNFGGKTIYGTLIDQLSNEKGWTLDYILWGISYANIKLIMADKVTSLYLSDEEKAKAGGSIFNTDDIIKADDPRNMERIRAMDWS